MLIIVIGLKDVYFNKAQTIKHNFPVVGHFRYMLEKIGPELRQYIVSSNREEMPFNSKYKARRITCEKTRTNDGPVVVESSCKPNQNTVAEQASPSSMRVYQPGKFQRARAFHFEQGVQRGEKHYNHFVVIALENKKKIKKTKARRSFTPQLNDWFTVGDNRCRLEERDFARRADLVPLPVRDSRRVFV